MEPAWAPHLPPGVHLDGADLTAGGSLPAVWGRAWAADPGRPVLFDATGADGARPRWVTAGELDDRTRTAAARLADLGAGPGDRVVLAAGSSLALVVANLGALRSGLVVVPANPDYGPDELGHVLGDARPAVVVADRPDRAAEVLVTVGGRAAVLDTALVRRADGPATASVRDPVLDAADPAGPALIGYTSGTTGAPKGAVLSHGNLLAGAEALRVAWRWTPDDRLVLCLPLFHSHGLCVGVYGSLAAGAAVVLQRGFDPAAVAAAVDEHAATLFFGVPTMYRRLLEAGRAGVLRRLRLAVSGSAPLPAGLHRQLAAASTVAVLERYGLTETLMNASNPYEGERRAGTVGFPLPGVEVRLAGRPEGSVGEGAEIWVRGPNVFGGYFGRPAATAEAFEDGWFRTGDLGDRDGDGYLRIRGRAKELIITGGFNVYPAEVEDVLLGHPQVAEVAVAGTPSDEWGETVTAWVVPAGAPPAPDELLAWAAARLVAYKRPRAVRFVDALPKTALGKVRRSELETGASPR